MTRQPLLFVVEANKTGSEHASFNSAVLCALRAGADSRPCEIFLLCDGSHRKALLELQPDTAAINWRAIPVVSGLKRSFIRKFAVELVVTLGALLRARKRGATVVFLSVFPNVLPFLILTRRLFAAVPVHVFLHGELESLLIAEKQSIHREGFWVRLALLRLFKGEWPYLHVLGRGIRQRLLDLFPALTALRALKTIEHPYAFNRSEDVAAHNQGALRVGFVGAGRRIKGIVDFFRIAESLSDHIAAGRLQFALVGGLDHDVRDLDCKWVEVLGRDAVGIAAQDYRREITRLDCALFLFGTNYILTASGSAFDVINEGVEILSLKSEYMLDLAASDTEGGIKLFPTPADIGAEIRRRVEAGCRRGKFRYAAIKDRHSRAVAATLQAEILSTVSKDGQP